MMIVAFAIVLSKNDGGKTVFQGDGIISLLNEDGLKWI
jgi:hypothetical protein